MTGIQKHHYLAAISALLVLFLLGACSPLSALLQEETLTPTATVTNTPQPPTATMPAHPSATNTATVVPTPPDVQSFPDSSSYTWTEVVSGLTRPIGLTSAGDGSGRIFIIEQPGRILIHDGAELVELPYLDIRDQVRDKGSEQGLLGLAFHPDYSENGYFFINYTDKTGANVVSRFQVSSNPDQADPGSESKLLSISQPYKNHNGGQILFGPQGYLWIASGDGGSAGDPEENAQDLGNLLGKLLRIDVNQEPYAIPDENPFGDEIWAYGLRNPWRFTFDPANGDLYIADVGQATWEEINYIPSDAPAGANFGWDYREGKHTFEGTPPGDLKMIDPVMEYNHNLGCSVSGGAVYRGSMLEWQGIYLYGDFCSGQVWGLLRTASGEWMNESLFKFDSRITAIDQDEAGEIYLLDLLGTVLKLTSP